jgi:heat-inducible transcriptional repressor
MPLTARQRTILNAVIEQYIDTGAPVPSKGLAAFACLDVSSSTVRNEFAVLEEHGYLTHPHVSAGRVPTDMGYREFVDHLMSGGSTVSVAKPDMAVSRRDLDGEVNEALRQITERMSRATDLLALAVAPRVSGAQVCHVELLDLQPDQLMYVFVVSTGGVMKGVIDMPGVIDLGLLHWARTYLNETLNRRTLTARLIRRTLDNPELSARESEFLSVLTPAFAKLVDEQQGEEMIVGGAARLLTKARIRDVSCLHDLLVLLEERAVLLRVLRKALGRGDVVVRIGGEHEDTELQPFSMVSAGYGLPQRRLGSISLMGPTRMDYGAAICTVRQTAQLISELVEDRYE